MGGISIGLQELKKLKKSLTDIERFNEEHNQIRTEIKKLRKVIGKIEGEISRFETDCSKTVDEINRETEKMDKEFDKIKKVQNDLEEGKLIEIEQLRDKIKINQNLKEELNRQIGRKGVFDEYPDLDFLEAVDYMIGELSKERKTKAKIATFFTIMFLPLFSYYFFNHTNVGITILFSFIFFMTFIIPLLTIISSWATNPSMKDLIHHDHTLGKRRKRYIASNFISVKSTIDYHEWERNTVVSDYLEDERKLKTKLKLIANPEPPKIKKIQAKLTGHRSFLERRKKELTARKSELEERNESLSSLNTELENLKAKMDSLWSGIKHLIPNSELV